MADCTLKLDTRRALQDGTFPIKVSVGHGTKLYLSTGLSVRAENWEDGKVVGRNDARLMNAALKSQLVRISARVLRLRESGRFQRLTQERLRVLLSAPDMDEVPEVDERPTFWEIAGKCAATKDGRTREVYEYTIRKVREFVGDSPFYMEDIDRLWLHDFDAFIGGKVNARGVHLRNLRHICNFALDEECTTHYPFRKFKIRTEETRKKALALEQVRALLSIPGANEYRDVFILMLYLRGINIGDLSALTEKDVVNGRIEYRRNKTGQLYSIRLEPEALEILERWKGERHLLACFDRYASHRDYNHHLNAALKKMARPDGSPVEPDLSSNWARHTWATLCAELDVPDPTISLGMGHRIAGHKTTAIYIKRDMAKVDEANRRVIDFVLGKETAPRITAEDGTTKT